ncbi:unnamed protein product [Phytophthora lilii]|uniref:Unnamed protein product n=1 Tax=Phytophthora lilii TaxID=2077276 RepID=A0A9W6YJ17_9STRA|nr:unnamed protein product [Phytophthora lilii]
MVLHPDLKRKAEKDCGPSFGASSEHTKASDLNETTGHDAVRSEATKEHDHGAKPEENKRPGLVEMPEPDSEGDGAEELQVYAAFAAIALLSEPTKTPQQRIWQNARKRAPRLYYFSNGDTTASYGDDIICATNKESWKTKLFVDLHSKYGIKDLGRLNNYLGVQVDWQHDGVLLHQAKYAKAILERFGFADAIGCRSPMDTTVKLRAACKGDKEPRIPYREAMGALMYLATSTRPDLAFPVGY